MIDQDIDLTNRLRVAVLCGSDDERSVIWARQADIGSTGNNDSWRLINALDNQRFGWRRTHITPGYFRQPRRWSFERFSVIWNMITDPDQNPATLEVATKLLAEVKLPVVNKPSLMALTRRDRIAERLQGTPDVVVPKVLLIRNPNRERIAKAVDAAGFRFPAIVRQTGTQSGRVLGVFERVEDLQAIFGDRRHDYFMTEFYNLQFSDGHFRKTRYMFIGDRVVPRQHIVSDGWNIHGADTARVTIKNESFKREMDELLLGGFDVLPQSVRSRLLAIRARIPLDYVGIDCCVTEDHRLVVFEVNATMNIWPKADRIDDPNRRIPNDRAIAAVGRLILAKAGRDEQPVTAAREMLAAVGA